MQKQKATQIKTYAKTQLIDVERNGRAWKTVRSNELKKVSGKENID